MLFSNSTTDGSSLAPQGTWFYRSWCSQQYLCLTTFHLLVLWLVGHQSAAYACEGGKLLGLAGGALLDDPLGPPVGREQVDEQRYQDQPGYDKESAGGAHLVIVGQPATETRGQRADHGNDSKVALGFGTWHVAILLQSHRRAACLQSCSLAPRRPGS